MAELERGTSSSTTVTRAIVLGGQIERLVAQLQQIETRKARLLAGLASVERISGRPTLQDRLVSELRLRGIATLEAANATHGTQLLGTRGGRRG